MSDSHSSELRARLALHLMPGLGPRLTSALLQHFGSPQAIMQANAEQLQVIPHLGPKLARQMVNSLHSIQVEPEIELAQKHQTQILLLNGPDYPSELAHIYDPPQVLYVRGAIQPCDREAVALVGSRNCSNYGKRITERLATDLARAGYTVVSGLARGIDGFAHRAALQAGGRTLAVLANGLASIYPPEHRDLAREICGKGAVLSEAPMQQSPLPGMFPARNRLISGLSRAIVIVEAAERSGALITAEHAAEQGRLVFAVPGPVDDPASAGANELLRKGAILCRHAGDIIDELRNTAPLIDRSAEPRPLAKSAPQPELETKPIPAPTPVPTPKLEGIEQRIWEQVTEAVTIDELADRLSLGVAELNSHLFMLELKKVLKRLPGNRFERA